MSSKLPPHITGNTGLYYVCYELSKRGWNVMPTSRNARGADIIAYSIDGKRTIIIEVKSVRKKSAVWFDPSSLSNYLIICRNVYDSPELFIVCIDDSLKSKLVHHEKDDKKSFWLNISDFKTYKDNWDIIGKGIQFFCFFSSFFFINTQTKNSGFSCSLIPTSVNVCCITSIFSPPIS